MKYYGLLNADEDFDSDDDDVADDDDGCGDVHQGFMFSHFFECSCVLHIASDGDAASFCRGKDVDMAKNAAGGRADLRGSRQRDQECLIFQGAVVFESEAQEEGDEVHREGYEWTVQEGDSNAGEEGGAEDDDNQDSEKISLCRHQGADMENYQRCCTGKLGCAGRRGYHEIRIFQGASQVETEASDSRSDSCVSRETAWIGSLTQRS